MSDQEIVKKESVEEVNPIAKGSSLFFDIARFELAQRVAKVFSESDMVPKQFQRNLANCVIALNLSERLRVDPFMLMQNMYIVHGRPGLEGKLRIALINGCGRFTPLKFRFEGKGKTDKGVDRPNECIAYATEKESKQELSVSVSWETVVAEGWQKDKGNNEYKQTSKWQTMPYQMFRYRAAAFFERAYCPEVTMGLTDIEENIDIVELEQGKNGTYAAPKSNGKPTLEQMAEEESKKEEPSSKEQIEILLDECFEKDTQSRESFLYAAIGKKQTKDLTNEEAQKALEELHKLNPGVK